MVPPRLCTDCHINNNYNLTSTACITCHLKDFQGTTNPNHVAASFLADLRAVPQHDLMADCTFDHNSHRVPADRLAHGSAAAVHRLPRQQQLQPYGDGLRLMPSAGFPGHDESESRQRELPADLRAVPQHDVLAERDVQPQQHRLPPDRPAHRAPAAMHRLPRQQQLQPDEHRLRDVPSGGFPRHNQSESRQRQLPADLPAVSQHHVMAGRYIRPQHDRLSVDRNGTRCRRGCAPIATSTTTTT